jgi:hypothetical protein
MGTIELTDGRVGIGTRVRFFEDGITWEVTTLEQAPGLCMATLRARGATPIVTTVRDIVDALDQVPQD